MCELLKAVDVRKCELLASVDVRNFFCDSQLFCANVPLSNLTCALQISAVPKVYVYDTPGIMLPHIPDMDVGMRLALCGNDAYCFTVVMACFSCN